MSTVGLPAHLLGRAIRSGFEFGWRKEEFLQVLQTAASDGYACVGGQFQWVFSDGTCEAYWLNANSTPRQPNEPWSSYVKRTEAEVTESYEALLRETDFSGESDKWDFLKNKKAAGVSLDEHLIFVAYFDGIPPDELLPFPKTGPV